MNEEDIHPKSISMSICVLRGPTQLPTSRMPQKRPEIAQAVAEVVRLHSPKMASSIRLAQIGTRFS